MSPPPDDYLEGEEKAYDAGFDAGRTSVTGVTREQRSAFLTQIHDLGLDALVLSEHDTRPGVLVSQDQLLAILRLLDPDALDSKAETSRLITQLAQVRFHARQWDAEAVELTDDSAVDDATWAVRSATLTQCARAIFEATDAT
jgi:hypothetical protein